MTCTSAGNLGESLKRRSLPAMSMALTFRKEHRMRLTHCLLAKALAVSSEMPDWLAESWTLVDTISRMASHQGSAALPVLPVLSILDVPR